MILQHNETTLTNLKIKKLIKLCAEEAEVSTAHVYVKIFADHKYGAGLYVPFEEEDQWFLSLIELHLPEKCSNFLLVEMLLHELYHHRQQSNGIFKKYGLNRREGEVFPKLMTSKKSIARICKKFKEE